MRFNGFLIVAFVILIFSCCTPKVVDEKEGSLDFDMIRSKIESANDGDTIIIPVGTCVIPVGISIDKRIYIKGAGIDNTIFKADPNMSAGFLLQSLKADNVRISGITFHMNHVLNCGGLYIYDEHHHFRIDHCKFTDAAYAKIGGTYDGRPLKIEGYTDGVIDHCQFLNNRFTDIAVLGDLQKYNNAGKAWSRPIVLGGSDGVVFVEDCSFVYEQKWMESNYPATSAIASNDGARYVFRHNTINAGYYKNGEILNWHESPIDAHGNYITGHRGSVSIEVYENTITSPRICYGINVRGGTGVIFNNRFVGAFNTAIHLINYRSFEPPLTGEAASVCTHFTPGVSECINVDHGIDQVNNLFIWGNTYEANGAVAVPVSAVVDDRGHNLVHIQEGVAFFNEKQPNGVLKSPWTSYTHGIYTPFTYPHPLTVN